MLRILARRCLDSVDAASGLKAAQWKAPGYGFFCQSLETLGIEPDSK